MTGPTPPPAPRGGRRRATPENPATTTQEVAVLATGSGGRRSAGPTGGRTRTGTLNPLVVLAVVLPLLTLLVLQGARTWTPSAVVQPPTRSPLASTTLLCPASTDGGRTRVAAADPATGGTLGSGGLLDLAPGAVVEVPGPVVTGTGATAVGLAAVHTTKKGAAFCATPSAEHWFTGVGSGPEHRSVLEFNNPDGGTAVADVLVLGANGVLDVPALQGVSVPGLSTTTLDLSTIVPQREDLALQVKVSRGRLGVVLHDRIEPLGDGDASDDWLAPAREPGTGVTLLGLGQGSGPRLLTVANPGQDEVRVRLELLTATSTFAPAGLEEVRVPPTSATTLDLTDVLGDPTAADASGVVVAATGPVTAGLRGLVDGDLVQAVPAPGLDAPAGGPLPGRATRLLLAGAQEEGTVTVQLRTADGTALPEVTVEVAPGHDSRADLPAEAAWLTVDPGETGTGGAVELGDKRLAVLPLVPLRTHDLVPAARPALR